MINIPAILEKNFPGQEFTLEGDTYEGLTWLSETPKPTEKELKDLWQKTQEQLVLDLQAKLDAKTSAISKLKSLGLTIEEVQVAFGLSE